MIARIVLGLALCSCVCQAQDAEITTKTISIPAMHGKPETLYERTYRGKACIMIVVSEKRPSGEFVQTARSFYVGHAMVVESDEDRDGFFETLTVFDTGKKGDSVEAFTRARDGTTHPVSREKLNELKKWTTAIARFWDESLPPK